MNLGYLLIRESFIMELNQLFSPSFVSHPHFVTEGFLDDDIVYEQFYVLLKDLPF